MKGNRYGELMALLDRILGDGGKTRREGGVDAAIAAVDRAMCPGPFKATADPLRNDLMRAALLVAPWNLSLAIGVLQNLETYRGPGATGRDAPRPRNRRDPTAAELAARGDAIPDEDLPAF